MILFESCCNLDCNLLKDFLQQNINKIKYDYYLRIEENLIKSQTFFNIGILLEDKYDYYNWIRLTLLKDSKYFPVYLKKLNTYTEYNELITKSTDRLLFISSAAGVKDEKYIGTYRGNDIIKNINYKNYNNELLMYNVFKILLYKNKNPESKPKKVDNICKL